MRVNVEQGITVVHVVIVRDGRLPDINVAAEIKGDRATFTLPLVSSARQ